MGSLQSEDAQHAQVPRKLALVTHSRQRLVGVGIDGGLPHGVGEINKRSSQDRSRSRDQ